MRVFADTNVIIYAQSDDGEKTVKTVQVLEGGVVISAQVVNETISVLTAKHGFPLVEAHQIAAYLLASCEIVPLDANTIREAIRLSARYRLPHWDALIIGAALLANCDRLYSEDFQNGKIFDERLTVVNPFLAESRA